MTPVRIERNYRTDDGDRRAALVVDGTVRATLTGTECFALADDLMGAGEHLLSADSGDDDDDDVRRCPQCGTPITAVTSNFDTAKLAPCGHEIAADHPVLQGENEDRDSN